MSGTGQLETQLIPEIRQYLLIIDARYLVATGEHEAALTAYNDFLQTEYARINHNIYKEALLEKADLLVKMGNKEEAYGQYGKVFSYIKTSFEKNYPKEIDRLCTRFQADQLAYQNERDRIVSMRFYLAGIIVSVLFLIFLLVLGWKKIFRLKHSQMRQEAMKEKAVQAIQRKNMFLSNMSHEVRTPLNAIVGFSAVLTDEDESFDDESRREFSEIIKVNSFQLLKLINDILDFSDFENDNITFNIRTHDAVKLCNEVVETVMVSRKLEVEMRFDTDLSVLMLDTDDARLRQVLINLLVNATKFTEQGSIVLELKMADAIIFGVNGKPIKARTPNQQLLVKTFTENDLTFALGPAGTGKTYLAVAMAVRALKNREVRKIILSRPAVEAGEKLGFLPGDMKDKIDPYLQPLYDALEDMIPNAKLKEYMETKVIQIAPLAFMRGRTLNDAIVVLDEAQNTTTHQIKMFLTRLGMGSKMIVTGDVTQIDLPRTTASGLIQALKILRNVKGIGRVEFEKKDIVRHHLVQRIVEAYERHDEEERPTPPQQQQ